MTRLRHVASDALTIARRPHGRGHAFFDVEGRRITDKELRRRVRSLAIPPAWKEVRVAPDPRAHIQAVGIDGAGRVQYLYHPQWELRRTLRKQRNLAALVDT